MIEFFTDADNQHRFRITGKNGEVVASSESYATKSNAQRGYADLWAIVAENAPSGMKVEDEDEE